MSKEKVPAASGEWGETTRWELFLAHQLPPRELCSSVFCIPFNDRGKVWLMCDEDRGWGLIGGHIKPTETIEAARDREADAEAGITPLNPRLYAAMQITASKPVPHQDQGREYPFPISYQVYFHCGIDGPVGKPTESDSLEARAFTLEEIKQLGITDLPIIQLAYNARMSTEINY